MSDFWAGYLLGRGGGDDSVPSGIAVLLAVFLGFVALLFVFQRIFEVVASTTQRYPVLVYLVVGAVTAGIGERFGAYRDLDVETKLLAPGILATVAFAVFWLVGELAGVSSFDETPLVIQLPMLGLSLVSVGGFAYMLVGVGRYRCGTRYGRLLRAVSLVCFAWWGWGSVFTSPLSAVPILRVNVLLGVTVIAALATGVVEILRSSKATTDHEFRREG